VLCRDVFHCRISELREERAVDILKALACLAGEAKVREHELEKARKGR